MGKDYKCALCHLEFESDSPQTLTHPDDLNLVGLTTEDAKKQTPVVCPECLIVEPVEALPPDRGRHYDDDAGEFIGGEDDE